VGNWDGLNGDIPARDLQESQCVWHGGVEVDGMDVLAVRAVAQAAVARARAGEGPTLIEALTHRFRGTLWLIQTKCAPKLEKNFGLPVTRLKFAAYLRAKSGRSGKNSSD